MYGTDTKKMRSKIFLAVLLLTPILVVTFSTLYFLSGMSPEGTKNNGVFFKSYFDLNDFKNIEGKQDLIKFEDGKWILSVYVTNIFNLSIADSSRSDTDDGWCFMHRLTSKDKIFTDLTAPAMIFLMITLLYAELIV